MDGIKSDSSKLIVERYPHKKDLHIFLWTGRILLIMMIGIAILFICAEGTIGKFVGLLLGLLPSFVIFQIFQHQLSVFNLLDNSLTCEITTVFGRRLIRYSILGNIDVSVKEFIGRTRHAKLTSYSVLVFNWSTKQLVEVSISPLRQEAVEIGNKICQFLGLPPIQ